MAEKSNRSRRSASTTRTRGKAQRKKGWNYPRAGLGPVRRWLPSWRVVLGVVLAGLAAVAGLFAWAYATTDLPEVDEMALAESSTIYFADGETEMGTLAEINRNVVDTTELPDYVGDAVVASEDRRFYSNSGIDPIGIARAFWNNVTGGSQQGASTLTQQYVDNYYLGQTQSYADKAREAILAIKVEQEMTKDEILDAYLNVIYFGRGAYGIDAAAQAYFGIPASELTVSQSALLAGIIPAPSAWDPAVSPEQAEYRWERTLSYMLEDGLITQAEFDDATYPETIEGARSDRFAGTNGYLMQMVIAELTTGEEAPFTEDELNRLGLTIVSTVDAQWQADAVETIEGQVPEDAPEGFKATLVSIDPATGGVKALYGGEDYLTESLNRATQARYQGGSTFKPFALITALSEGISLEQQLPSYTGMDVDGYVVNNYDNIDRGYVNLVEGLEYSVNSTYVALNAMVGPENTMETAIAAGLPEDTLGLNANLSNVLGNASPHAIDMATVFATYADQGIRHDAHIVERVTDSAGVELYAGPTEGERVFEADVMADATYAMTQVVEVGTGRTASALGRPVAGKTGSANEYRGSSFGGYIPQLATVVAAYQTGADGEEVPIDPFGGYSVLAGGSLPTDLWLYYMTQVTEGMPIEDFPPRANVGAIATPTAPQTTEPALVAVPDVAGMSEAEASEAIIAAGFSVASTSEPSEDVEEGIVIRAEPGGEAEAGSVITIVVSTGPSEPTTEEPTTPEPTTPEPTTPEPTTPEPTTPEPTTPEPTLTATPTPQPTDGDGQPEPPSTPEN